MNLCEAEGFAIIHLAGNTSRAPPGPRTDTARRAKGGYCPRCAQATRVAIPAEYQLGDFRSLKSRGMAVRNARGPWAPRAFGSWSRCSQIWTALGNLGLGNSVPIILLFRNPPEFVRPMRNSFACFPKMSTPGKAAVGCGAPASLSRTRRRCKPELGATQRPCVCAC